MFARFFHLNLTKLPPSYVDSVSTKVNPSLAFNILQKSESKQRPIIELLDSYDLPDSEKQPLIELYQQLKDKIVYHDFWFTGCVPCMNELPHYNGLIEQADDVIAFVFFGAHMEEKEWRETVDHFQLKGVNYLLNKNQIAFFEKFFGVKGYPHHEILDSEGRMVEIGNIPGIRPGNYPRILNMFDEIKSITVKEN